MEQQHFHCCSLGSSAASQRSVPSAGFVDLHPFRSRSCLFSWFLDLPLVKVLLDLLTESCLVFSKVLEWNDSESVIFQGAVASHCQRVVPRFLQLSQRKELNRQHNQPRTLGHIAILKADWSWQLLPSFASFVFQLSVLTVGSSSRRLIALDSTQRWSARTKVNTNPARSHVTTTEEKGTEVWPDLLSVEPEQTSAQMPWQPSSVTYPWNNNNKQKRWATLIGSMSCEALKVLHTKPH